MQSAFFLVHFIVKHLCILILFPSLFVAATQQSGQTNDLNWRENVTILNRRIREVDSTNKQSTEMVQNSETHGTNTFENDEIAWSNINKEVDMVIPMVVEHLSKLDNIQYLTLTDMNESISINPLFIKYEVGIFLTNGIAYNIAGIKRHGDAFMTYANRTFLTRFNIVIQHLQFEYDFLLKLTPIEGYGKVIGYLEDMIIYAELGIDIVKLNFELHDFRIRRFRNIHVELDEMRLIRELTGAILSPITNLFREHITSSISDSLRDQMQAIMSDFSNDDPLELRSFTKKLITGLLG